ncbi:hypothetical protein [Mucilaginibacter arboris]|uniref:Uncharacterized protein n=1 Tax=Mucilaginibacter arboris TaxID=2682090 RepID=A0A7K1SWA0_9SPHI|nr:hypothetical protein [Mucilaginibacter arboris]MVN21602.1 hypothetical protein [Mucilaginibacter arboris]
MLIKEKTDNGSETEKPVCKEGQPNRQVDGFKQYFDEGRKAYLKKPERCSISKNNKA